jgi:hypothetical protein
MRRIALGIGVGVGAFLGASLAAEAQITITGDKPAHVYHSDSQSTYEATVTWTGSYKFQLKVFLNGVQKYQSSVYNYSSPGPTQRISHTVTGMNTWGMQAGQQLDYRGKVWTSPSNQNTHDWYVTVEQGTSKLLPDRKKLPFGDPNREELLAEVVRREERDWA